MKLEFEGTEYWLEFTYGTHKGKRTVGCRIFEPCDRDSRASGRCFGGTVCAKEDRFERETGRKLALTRSLQGESKEFRRAAWQAYMGRKTR